MKNRRIFLLLACSTILFVACRKDTNDNDLDLDYMSASDNARAEDAFTDLFNQVEKSMDENGLREACDPVVTFDTIAEPHSMTLDFGTVDCTAQNGRQRRGRIHVTWTGRYRDPGTVITMTPDEYFVNGNQVQGTKTVTNLGPNDEGNLQFHVVVDGSLTAGDGSWTSTHQAQRTRTWIQGADTPGILDDVYLITGSGSGTNRNGVNYTVNITSPLRVELSCPFITAGSVDITPENRPTRTINYGNGSCDGTITITVNGHTFTVTIG